MRPGDEVIVVDSASQGDDTRAVSAAAGARYLRCERPGASRARNAGSQAARNPVVAFVDDDVRVSPEWAAAIDRTLEAHPEVDFVAGKLVAGGHGTRWPVSVKASAAAETFAGSDRADGIGHGANLAVRDRALLAVGGFDDRLGPGTPLHSAEDVDLFDRLLAAGFLGRYEPAAAAAHVQWRTGRQRLTVEWTYGVGGGARVVKLALRGRDWRRTGVAAGALFWGWGLRFAFECVVEGRLFLALAAMVRMAGGVAGVVLAVTTRPWSTRRAEGDGDRSATPGGELLER